MVRPPVVMATCERVDPGKTVVRLSKTIEFPACECRNGAMSARGRPFSRSCPAATNPGKDENDIAFAFLKYLNFSQEWTVCRNLKFRPVCQAVESLRWHHIDERRRPLLGLGPKFRDQHQQRVLLV